MRYAQINEDGVCIGLSELSGEVDAPHMILIGDAGNYIGWTYDNGNWIEPPTATNIANDILSAPLQGFGGPTAKELFHGNR